MDRDTGKPKGFGFCEFHSKDDAESAYRNLNNTMFKGRQIRIDFAEENMSDRGYKGGYKDRGEYSLTPRWTFLPARHLTRPWLAAVFSTADLALQHHSSCSWSVGGNRVQSLPRPYQPSCQL